MPVFVNSSANKAIVDSRLRPSAHLSEYFQSLHCAKSGWNLGWCACCVLSLLRNTRNAPSSTKPEVCNVSHRHQRRIESWPQATCAKIGEVQPNGFSVMWVDRQTHRHTHYNTSQP